MAEKTDDKTLHGNKARISPGKEVVPAYATNAVTASNRKERGVPLVEDENVRRARNFSEENQK